MQRDVTRDIHSSDIYYNFPSISEIERDYNEANGKRKKQKQLNIGDGIDEINKMIQGRSKMYPKISEYASKWHKLLSETMISLSQEKDIKKLELYFGTTDNLLKNPRVDNVSTCYTSGGKKYYTVKQKVLVNGTVEKYVSKVFGGLTERLTLAFYPDTSDNPIEKGKRNKELGGRAPLVNNIIGTCQARPCLKKAAQHGTMVHNQFEKITKMMTQTGKFDYYDKQNEEMDPCVQSFIDICIANKWVPFRSEFIVYDEDIKVTTAIDMILIDTTKWELLLVEFKTGFEHEEYGPHPNDVRFDEPLEQLHNCPRNRHMLQLLVMSVILEKKYATRIGRSYVVRMCPKAGVVEIYENAKWCTQEHYKSAVYQTLLDFAKYNIK